MTRETSGTAKLAAALAMFGMGALASTLLTAQAADVESCKAMTRGIDRLACYDKAHGVESKLAEPLPTKRVPTTPVRPAPPVDTVKSAPRPEEPIAPELLRPH